MYTTEKVCLISVVSKTEHEHNVSFHYGCMLNDKWDNNYFIIIILLLLLLLLLFYVHMFAESTIQICFN